MAEILTDTNFSEFTQNNIALVDVFTTWCGPCKMLGPIIDQVSEHFENDNMINVGKLNAEENPNTMANLGVRNVPTILIYKNGQEVDRRVGLMQKNEIVSLLEEIKNESI